MRTLLLSLTLLSVILLMVSCGGDAAPDRTLELQNERDSLMVLAANNQIELERMTSFFDEVAACIDSITEQETLLATQIDIETHRRYSSREISQRLNQLSEIITGQRQRIASIVDSLNNRVDTTRTSGLRSTISYLTNELARKEEQIKKLRAEISGQQRSISKLSAEIDNLTETVGDLTIQNSALTEAVKVQTEIINEGYVLVASKQQLKSMGVIEGGGFLKSSKIKLSNVNISKCSKLDIATFRELPIQSRKVKILSPAPESSYVINRNGDVSKLVITDATAFWSLSNILVIQTQ